MSELQKTNVKTVTEALVFSLDRVRAEGYTPAGVFLYGSQNYNLDTPESDFDLKCFVLPTLRQLVVNAKPVSKVLEFDFGQVEVKDVRLMYKLFQKANPAYLETLFTKHYLSLNPQMDELVEMREEVAAMNKNGLVKASYGMFKQKQTALRREYPSTLHKVKEYGYDGKQGHHCLRLLTMMTDYFVNGKSFQESLVPTRELENLWDWKLQRLPDTPELDEKLNEYEEMFKYLRTKVESLELGFNDATGDKVEALVHEMLYSHLREEVKFDL